MSGLTETVVFLVGGCGLIVVGIKAIIDGASMPTGYVVPGIESPGFTILTGLGAAFIGVTLLFLLCFIREKEAEERKRLVEK